jgi:hypothetical protein
MVTRFWTHRKRESEYNAEKGCLSGHGKKMEILTKSILITPTRTLLPTGRGTSVRPISSESSGASADCGDLLFRHRLVEEPVASIPKRFHHITGIA